MDIHVDLHVQKCTRFYTLSCTYMYKYGKISFRFISPNFGRNFAETKQNTALAKRNFGEISPKFLFVTKQKNYISGKTYVQPTLWNWDYLLAPSRYSTVDETTVRTALQFCLFCCRDHLFLLLSSHGG
jgi:hypothetical protein